MGDLPVAIERLERATEGETLFGSAGNAHMAYSSAFLALAWLGAATALEPGRCCSVPAIERAPPTASASG
jgi:hypothetical protein